MNINPSIQSELDTVTREIRVWNQKKAPGERMSAKLWDRVAALCQYLPQKRVASAIGVQPYYLKKRLESRKVSGGGQSKENQFLPVGVICNSKVRLDLKGASQKSVELEMSGSDFNNNFPQILDWLSRKS
jgi:hypothetical protein